MGLLKQGKWIDEWYDTTASKGKFIRQDAMFRNWVTTDGSAGLSGRGGFKAEPNRYHLYISLACPWAHRTLIFRVLKGLDQIISISVVDWFMGANGWTFKDREGVIPDINGKKYLHEIYTLVDPNYTGRVTVPVLWDKKINTIVSNESSEIIRMFNSAFDNVGAKPGDYYPEKKREEINNLNDLI